MATYHTKGVCAGSIQFEVDDGKVTNVSFKGGCDGNLQAIGRLVNGMRVEDVIERLKGISCSNKPTSCADQLARALETATGK